MCVCVGTCCKFLWYYDHQSFTTLHKQRDLSRLGIQKKTIFARFQFWAHKSLMKHAPVIRHSDHVFHFPYSLEAAANEINTTFIDWPWWLTIMWNDHGQDWYLEPKCKGIIVIFSDLRLQNPCPNPERPQIERVTDSNGRSRQGPLTGVVTGMATPVVY